MAFDNTKKKILAVKFISCIIINFLRLKELKTNIINSSLVDKLTLLKDLSKLSYDILTFNLVSLVCNTVPIFFKFKKIIGKFLKKNKNE
jgi:hypothetical protein